MERSAPKAVKIGPASLAYIQRETPVVLDASNYGSYIVVSSGRVRKWQGYQIMTPDVFNAYYEFIYFQEPDFFVEVRRKV